MAHELQLTSQPAQHLDRKDALIVAALIAIAALLRLYFYHGIASIDEFNYLRHAAELWQGRFDLSEALYLHATRPAMFAPVAALFVWFGASEASAIAWPFAASLASVIFIYLIAHVLYGRQSAIAAGTMAAILPLMVAEATRLLPGGVTNMIMGASALCFVVSERAQRMRAVWLFLAGVIFGSIHFAGELGLVLGSFFAIALVLWRKHGVWTYWPAAAGVFAVAALTVAHHAIVTGDPLFKRAISQSILTVQIAAVDPTYYTRVLLHPLGGHGGVFFLAGVAAISDRRRQTILLSLWFAVTWLIIEYASTSLTHYQPLYKSVRYLSVVSVPGAILAGVGILRISAIARARLTRTAARATVVVVLMLVAALSVTTLQRSEPWIKERRATFTALQQLLREWPDATIYVTHWSWNTRVGFFKGFPNDYFPSGYDPYHAVNLRTADADSKNRYVQTLEPGHRMAHGLLLHDERLFAYSQNGGAGSVGPGEIPRQLANPPAEWRLVDRFDFANEDALTVYEIPEGAKWPEAP